MSLSTSSAHSSGSRASGSDCKPVQILRLTKDKTIRYLCINESLNRHLDAFKDYEVAVIPIVGPSRKGKSFLLDYMARYLRAQMNQQSAGQETQWIGGKWEALKGFSWKADTVRETEGIWMSEPFVVERTDGSKLAVLLLDTQGVFDTMTSKRDWLTIVGICLMVASITIFNVFTDIQEDTLIFMDSFLDAGLRASNSMSSSESQKPFQNLLFLVRDWEITSKHKCGLTGGSEYLEFILQGNEEQSDDTQHARQLLKECFDTVECFLMPRIGGKVSKDKFNGSHGQLAMDFTKKLKELIVHILFPDYINAKQINGRPITVKDFIELFNNLVHLFNNQDFQENDEEMSIMLGNISSRISDKVTIRKIRALHLDDFRMFIQSKSYISDKALNEQNTKLNTNYFNLFEDEINSEDYDRLKIEFETCIADNFHTIYAENKRQRQVFIDALIQECKERFEALHSKQVEGKDFKDLFQVEDKLRAIQQEVVQYLQSRVSHEDLETVFKVEMLTLTDYLAKAREEIMDKVREQNNKQKDDLNYLISTAVESYTTKMKHVLERVNQIERDSDFVLIEKRVRAGVVTELNTKLVGTDQTNLLIAEMQLKSALKARKEHFRNDYLAKVKILQDITEQLKQSSVETYRSNMNQFVHQFNNKAEFERHNNFEMSRVIDDFRRKCQLTEGQAVQQLADFQTRLHECHNQFLNIVDSKETLYRTAFNSAIAAVEQKKDEFKQGDWVFKSMNMDEMRRSLKKNAAETYSGFFDNQSPPYHEYLYQLKNDIDDSVDQYADELNTRRQAILQDYNRITADLALKFEDKYKNCLELKPDRTSLSKEQLLIKFGEKVAKSFKFETEHNVNKSVEEKIRTKFMANLLEISHKLDQEHENARRMSREILDNVIKKGHSEYEQIMNGLVYENVVLDDNTFREKERDIRRKIIMDFEITMISDPDNKTRYQPQLVQALDKSFNKMSSLKIKNRSTIDSIINRNLSDYRQEMERRLLIAKSINDLNDFSITLRSGLISSMINEMNEMPQNVLDQVEVVANNRMDSELTDIVKEFEIRQKDSNEEIERKMTKLNDKFCKEFNDIINKKMSYTDEILSMKIRSNKSQLMTEFQYFIRDKASDETIDSYLSNMNNVFDNYGKDVEEMNKNNRKLSEDQLLSKAIPLTDTYTSIMKSKVHSVNSERDFNDCHENAYKQVKQDFNTMIFADKTDREHCKAKLKECLTSAKEAFANDIKQKLIKTYRSLIEEKLSKYIDLIQMHIEENQPISVLDKKSTMLMNSMVFELKKSISREFDIDVDSLLKDLEQSIGNEYSKIREQEHRRRENAIQNMNDNLPKFVQDYQNEIEREMTNVSATGELLAKHSKIKDHRMEVFTEFYRAELSKGDLIEYSQQLAISMDERFHAEIMPLWQREDKKRAQTIDNLKTKVSTYYQDEINKHLVKNLYIEDEELMTIHSNLSHDIIKKFETDFECLPKTLYLKTLRMCIKIIFEKIREQNHLYKPKETHAIGIDLGTTNSCAAYFHPSDQDKFRVIIVPSELNRPTTSSVVSVRDNEELVGDVAKEEIYAYPKNTVVSAKRLIGRKFTEEAVQKNLKQWPYEVVKGKNDNAVIRIKVNNEVKTFMPEEISAKVLKRLKEQAVKKIGVEVNKAVITVPAYFTDAQKEATINAGKIAGLDVLKIINEPTAAAISYRLNWCINTRERKIVVYDFGGGTFDVSVLVVTEGELDVRAVGGDNQLGGDNFDSNLMNYCLNDFKQKNTIRAITGDEGDQAMCRLRAKCEKAKIILSASQQTKITLNNFYSDKNLEITVTREIFENLNKLLVNRSIDILMKTLREAKMAPKDIDDVVLVGGTTRVPIIETELKKKFRNKELNHSVNPDEAVAVGAAIQAAMLNENQSLPISNLKLSDVAPMSLGVELVGQRFDAIIAKNTKVPVKKTMTYYTSANNQTVVDITVYEGESVKVAQNNKLGSFRLTDIPKARAGQQEIPVTFDLNDEGLLHVSARVKSTGMEGEINIEATKGRLSDEDLEELIRRGA